MNPSQVADRVVELTRGRCDEAQVMVCASANGLARFADSRIHQSVAEQALRIWLRVNRDGQLGTATGNQDDEPALRELIERAVRATEAAEPAPDWPGVPAPTPADPPEAWDAPTAAGAPDDRAAVVRQVIGTAAPATVSGGCATGSEELAWANTKGLRRRYRRSVADLRVTVTDDGHSGFAAASASALPAIDADALAEEARTRLGNDTAVGELDEGTYDAILSPYAVTRLLEFLAFLGFVATTYGEGRSFMRLGDPVAAAAVSIWDDGADPDGLPLGFDLEGVPKSRVDFIRGGVATELAHDLRSACQAGTASTGHAAPLGVGEDPYPANLFMAPGTEPLADIVAGTDRAVWVTRVHYVNILDAKRCVLTGVTRDGTALVADGRVGPVADMRFTLNLREALEAVTAVSRERRLIHQMIYGYACAPAIRVPGLQLTRLSRPPAR